MREIITRIQYAWHVILGKPIIFRVEFTGNNNQKDILVAHCTFDVNVEYVDDLMRDVLRFG